MSGNTRTPVVINILSSIGTVFSFFIFKELFLHHELFRFFIEALFRVSGIAGTEVLVLPLAFSVGMTINTALLWFFFHKQFPLFTGQVVPTLKNSFYAAVTLGFVSYETLRLGAVYFDLDTFWGIFLQGACAGVVGIVAAVLLLRLLRSEELSDIGSTLHRTFWRSRPMLPSPDDQQL